jgi:catechol 2,3-dioxygenase
MVTEHQQPTTATGPIQPDGVSHLVLNVRDLERAHAFWTQIVGFKQVGEISRIKMRFYAGSGGNHHDLALMEVSDPSAVPESGERMKLAGASRLGLNHVAIRMPSEEAWERARAYIVSTGVPVDYRIEHGMSRSIYITDPDGHGIEILCDLPREKWEEDVNAALNYAKVLPTDGSV